MAKIIGVSTGITGKVGNELYQMWKGIQTKKTMFIPANPQTAAQTTNRTAFATLVETFKALTNNLVVYFWNVFATSHQTGWANLIGTNQAIQAGDTFDADNLVIAQGSLPKQDMEGASYEATTCTLAWNENTQAGASSDDLMFGAVYDVGTNKWAFNMDGVLRSAEQLPVTLPSSLVISDLKAFLVCYTGELGVLSVESCSDSTFYQVESF